MIYTDQGGSGGVYTKTSPPFAPELLDSFGRGYLRLTIEEVTSQTAIIDTFLKNSAAFIELQTRRAPIPATYTDRYLVSGKVLKLVPQIINFINIASAINGIVPFDLDITRTNSDAYFTPRTEVIGNGVSTLTLKYSRNEFEPALNAVWLDIAAIMFEQRGMDITRQLLDLINPHKLTEVSLV